MTTIASFIDHTALKPNTTKKQIDQLIAEAKQYQFASVCVNPFWVNYASEQLKDSNVLVCTVIGFPLGANTTTVKAFEATDAINNGAQEIDMVINIGAMIDHDYDTVEKDIRAVVEASNHKAVVKVILETCLLKDEEIKKASELAVKAGADFVKTSTGFSTGGATIEAVKIMSAAVPDTVGVKASGGVHNLSEALDMITAGATRIGASAGVQIVLEEAKENN